MVFYVGVIRAPGKKEYRAVESRKAADDIARNVARNAPGRVWIEGQQSASGRQHTPLSAEVIEAFDITPGERARLDAAPFRGTDDEGWLAFARYVQTQVLRAYAEGEIPLARALEVMLSCSIACGPAVRSKLLALTAQRALQNPPPDRRGKRPPNPMWVRNSAATLVQMLHEDRPNEPLAPNEMNGWTTGILEEAIRWLVTLRLCKPISARTLYDWYLEARKAGGAVFNDISYFLARVLVAPSNLPLRPGGVEQCQRSADHRPDAIHVPLATTL